MEPRPEFMREALRLAREHLVAGDGGPFGAVVVREGRILGRGWNRVTSTCDPTAHAEVEAIRDACRALGDFRLAGAELYASCEPCPLCLAASYWARIARVYYSATGAQAADAGFDDESIRLDLLRPPPERQLPLRRFLGDEGGPVFDLWRAKADRVPY